jgi:predicted TIM-barrel fold metal-dependent hydrolase
VLERFPTLKWVAAEHNIGWVPYFLQAVDQSYERWLKNAGEPLPMLPSAYVGRQVYFTFESDFVGAQSSDLFGADNFLWASDFPHPASTWPHSQKVIERDFEGVADDVVRKIVHDNAARLYGLDVKSEAVR